jgi:Heparinase II/III-like protein/Heparinase II/III N-terminus
MNVRKNLQEGRSSVLWNRSFNELWVRGCQEVFKRSDEVSYYLQALLIRKDLKTVAQASTRFLFNRQDLPGLAALLREKLPDQVQGVIASAERICRHEFDLLGYSHLEYGPEIDWHLEIVHGKRAPRKPWFRIHYLNFTEVGDVKIIWELNRHQHLSTLARAYNLTGREEFAAEVFHQWYHWWQQNPYPIGVNWASSLEVAFRSLSWLWVKHLLEEYPGMPRDFPRDLLGALAISGRHIARYISTYFSPNTHLLGEGVALFFIGTLCPQLPAAERWQRQGWEIVIQEATRQVQTDGMHFEQSIYYHVYALDFFLHVRMLAAANQIAIPSILDDTLERMLELLCGLGQAGAPPRLGDDDGGRLFDPRRNRTQHLLDPLAVGAALFERADFKAAGKLCEESIWLLGAEGVARFEQLPATRVQQRSVGFPASGTYVMSTPGPVPQQLVVDAGRLGSGTGGHSHSDALSVCLIVDGREWLIDPGTFVYISEDRERDYFRGTSAHNTLLIDGVSQAEPWKPFAWRSPPEVQVERWAPGESFDLLIANHSGYRRLPQPVIHQRCVFHLKSGFWFVFDLAKGDGSHTAELSWYLRPDCIALEKAPDCTCFVAEDQSVLEVLTPEGHDWKQQISTGWWSPAYGKKEVCPVLRFKTEAQLPVEFATLLHPRNETLERSGRLAKINTAERTAGVRGYLYSAADVFHYIFIADHEQRWKSGPWASDATFLYCGVDPHHGLRHLIMCGGSFVELDGGRIFAARHSVNCFEWFKHEQCEQERCTDKDAIEVSPAGRASEWHAVPDQGRDLKREPS